MSGGYLLYSAPNLKNTYIKRLKLDEQIPFKEFANLISNSNNELNNKLNKFNNYISSTLQLEKLTNKLRSWYKLNFSDFIKELNKAIKTAKGTPLTKLQEMEWMEVFETKKAEAQALKTEIEKTDKEIDKMVYELYGLSEEEIKIVEGENGK